MLLLTFLGAMSIADTAGAHDTTSTLTDPQRCGTMRVTVLTASAEDKDDICRSARHALDYLSELGLAIDVDIPVKVLSSLPDICGTGTIGCYVLAARHVLLLSYDALASTTRLFGLPIDRALYRTLVAHEIVHAVVAWNIAPESPSTLAMEYLSAVVSIAIMTAKRRRLLLDSLPGQGFTHHSQISLTYYLLSPARFSVNAFRHFSRPENGAAFVDRVLDGAVLADRNPHLR